MNDKTQRVFNGWLALTEAERRDFADAERRYVQSTGAGRQQIQESTRSSVVKLQTGPLGQTCPCCGR